MKNREKYPNTDDALKAFAEHNKVCKCGISFEDWLDRESGIGGAAAAFLGTLLAAAGMEADGLKALKQQPDGMLTGVECPICHGRNGRIGGMVLPSLVCEDCGMILARERPTPETRDSFAKFVAGLCGKNSRKD